MERRQFSSRLLAETLIVLLLFLALLYALYEVMQIFWGILSFALIFSVSFIDLFEWLCKKLNKKRTLTAVLYVIVLLILIALPIILLISTLHAHLTDLTEWLAAWKNNGLPDLPSWLVKFPILGNELKNFWTHIQNDPKALIQSYGPQAKSMLLRAFHGSTSIVGVSVQVITGIVASGFFLACRSQFIQPLQAIAQRLFGATEGTKLLQITEQAIKGVSIGVMGTAFITAFIGWIGIAIAGIPFSLGLSALIFFLVVLQVGPFPVWIPMIVWLFVEHHSGMAIFMIAYGIFVVVLENITRPILIAQSGKIPFLVLFIGFIGGLAVWGFTGMFKGAIVMAIGHTLLTSWLEKGNEEETKNQTLSLQKEE